MPGINGLPGIKIGIGMGGGMVKLSDEVILYKTGLVTPISGTQITKLDKLVKSIKTGLGITNLSDAFDTFYVLGGETAESSLKNIIKNAHHSQVVNTVSFTANKGFKGNKIDGSIRTNYKPATQGINFTQNSATIGTFSYDNATDATAISGALNTGATCGTSIIPNATNNDMYLQVNCGQKTGLNANRDSRGLFVATRNNANDFQYYLDDELQGTLVGASLVISDEEDCICAWNYRNIIGAYTDRTISAHFRGRGFNTNEIKVILNALKNYLLPETKIASTTANLLAIVGQSNAIGYYPDTKPTSIDYFFDQENIYIYFNALTGSNFAKANIRKNCGYDWITGMHTNKGFGAEQSAAHELKITTNKPVVIVKNGINGGVIANWDAGAAAYLDLEASLVKAVNSNDTLLTGFNTYQGLSLLWVQGESDASASATTAYYEAKLRSVINRLRSSDVRLANLQIVMVKLSALMIAIAGTQKDPINLAFANIASNTANTIILDPDAIPGIAIRADNMHYTAASLLKIGSVWKALIP